MKNPPAMLYEHRRGKAAVIWTVIIVCLYLLLAVILIIDMQIATGYLEVKVRRSSMEETVFDGDIVYAKKSAKAKFGDVIIIDVEQYVDRDGYDKGPGEKGDYCIIKRLIATEGDRVYAEGGTVYVMRAGQNKFQALTEPYVKGATGDFDPVTVGKNEIFFLGDNRVVSMDSRSVGCYLVSDIIGVVETWSLETKVAMTRWEIFGHAIGVL